jgi:hypothetical protein
LEVGNGRGKRTVRGKCVPTGKSLRSLNKSGRSKSTVVFKGHCMFLCENTNKKSKKSGRGGKECIELGHYNQISKNVRSGADS